MSRRGDPLLKAVRSNLRVTLEFSRSDDPMLFDELSRLPKGRRRVARLRTLAHDGLLASQLSAQPLSGAATGAPRTAIPDSAAVHVEDDVLPALDVRVTSAIFEEPADD